MTSRTLALSIVVTLSACGGGSGGETGSSGPGSSGPGSTSSGPSTGASTSEGSSAGSVTTTGITGGVTEASGTSTGGPSSSTSSGAGTSGEPDSSGAASSTGGAGGSCVDVSGDYGPCEAIIGYGFDGTTCRAFSGCNCAPHCDDFWPDELSCALGCAAAGGCNPAALHPAGVNKDPVQPGSFCDELDACSGSVEWLTKIFGKVECEPASYPCEQGQTCHLLWQGTLDEAQWSQVCAASLLPGADLHCVVWGP